MAFVKGHKHTMALDQSALLEVLEALKAAEVDDKIRLAGETIYQALIEAELSSVIGAAPYQRTDARTAQRNGHRPRTITMTAGDLELKIPKLRVVLPVAAGASAAGGPVAARSHHGGAPAWHLDAQGR
jgi:Transposase, Mutator family